MRFTKCNVILYKIHKNDYGRTTREPIRVTPNLSAWNALHEMQYYMITYQNTGHFVDSIARFDFEKKGELYSVKIKPAIR